jgi:hypothetical protein
MPDNSEQQKLNQINSLTLDTLKETLSDYFYGKEGEAKSEWKPPVNHRWTDEEGNHFSSWDLGNGVRTGDGGAEIYFKALQEQAKKLIDGQ